MDRAQTAHDFALGVGVLLLTVAFAFSTLPALTAPDDRNDGDVGRVHADRVAATAVDHLSVDGSPTRLDRGRTAAFFRTRSSGAALRAFFGLPDRWSLDVTIRNGSGIVRVTGPDGADTRLSAGDAVPGRSRTTAVRLVSFSGGTPCRSACRLVVAIG